MSWSLFKQNMLSFMQGQTTVNGETVNTSKKVDSYKDFAKKITDEYHSCMLRGFQQPSIVGSIIIGKGNTDLMRTLVETACLKALNVKKGNHNFIDDIGTAVQSGYWVGAEMSLIPPLQPVFGAIYNIAVASAVVSNPGTWSKIGKTQPVNDANIFLDILISGMKIHLTTISGTYFVSQAAYPGAPITIAPGFLPYVGYNIIPSASPPQRTPRPQPQPQEKTVEELLNEIADDNNTAEGAKDAIKAVGSVEFLSDEGQDAGPQIEEVKTELAKTVTAPPPVSTTAEQIDGTNDLEGEAVECGAKLDYEENFTNDVRLRTLSLDCTFPHKLKEQRGLTVEDIVCNLKAVAQNLVQPIKEKYPNVRINSGFRGTPSIPGGVSQHEKGEAIDIQFDGITPLGYLPITEWIVNNVAFDQIIFEHGNSIWLHISYKRIGTNRKKKLTMIKKGGRTTYEAGIKCYYNY